MARRTTVDGVVYSKFKANILELLKQYGFVKDFSIQGTDAKKVISIELKKVVNPVNDIPSVKFFSKPTLQKQRGLVYKKVRLKFCLNKG